MDSVLITGFLGYAKIVAPLHKLLGQLAAPKRGKCVGIGDLWDAECEVAFGKLKAALTTAPVLGYVDFKEPFILETDASQDGLGAILSQKQNGMDANCYSSKKIELLALKNGRLLTSSGITCKAVSSMYT